MTQPRRRLRRLAFAALVAVLLPATAVVAAASPPAYDSRHFEALAWREVGPYRGGRSAAVAGVPSQPQVYYFGGTGGGVWKTTDGGRLWSPVSDGFFGGAIGAVAVAESDPNVVYVGTGEKTVRGNVSHGDGMWKSVDAGKTWTHVGLPDSRHIPRVRVHPRDPDTVYAAALGHLFGPSDERGVYRSRDGGKTWQRVLFVSRDAGAIDLILDPTNPRVLYASTWRVRRTPWSLESGGPGSALWKSTDGGSTWVELSRNPGMPKGTLGIIGVAVSPSDPQNVYAIVEAEEGGVFRSRDGGATWQETNEDRNLRQRAWYYTRIYADPRDADTVYVPNVRFHKSKDGGKTFTTIPTPHGDNHDLWIAPDDPLRMVEANDGGANVSTDGGATWTAQDNQPTAQFYRVSTDNAFPYRLLGGQQDNSAVRIRSRGRGRGIGRGDWQETAGGESGHIVAHPENPDLVYGGSYGGFLMMLDHRSEEWRDVNPWPDNPMGHGAAGLTYRFQWNFPIVFSPHPPHALYAAANVLFASGDGGASWRAISPDLTRNDPSKMGASGGPITKDNTSVEYYGTIFAVAESPLAKGVLWAGTDDGLVHVSRDGGATWDNVTPQGMPQWIQVNAIEASPYAAGGAYLAATMYKWDDFRPYLYKTEDYGATWTRIDRGIPADHFTRVVRADPVRRGLLYAGTERGVHVSFDDGGAWQPLQLELPIVPITDLQVKDGDLVAATQGRGFWILDDLSPLRQISSEVAGQKVHFFTPRPALRFRGSGRGFGSPRNQGKNPPDGAIVDFRVDQPVGTEVKLAFLTQGGELIREFRGKVEEESKEPEPVAMGDGAPPPEPEAEPAATEEKAAEKPGKPDEKDKLTVRPGANRFAWDLRHSDAEEVEGMILWTGLIRGPRVAPGAYQARLTVGETVATAPFEVRPDPTASATQTDLEAQVAFLLQARDKLSEVHRGIKKIREVRAQIDDLKKRLSDDDAAKPVVDAIAALDAKMTAAEEALYQTKNKSSQDPLNFPIRLNDKLAGVADTAATGDFAPTEQARAVYAELATAIDAELAKLAEVWEKDLPELNRLAREHGVAAVIVKPPPV